MFRRYAFMARHADRSKGVNSTANEPAESKTEADQPIAARSPRQNE